MKGKQYETLEALLADVSDGLDATAFVAKYRAKDFFVLASDDSEALAAVAKSLGVEVGPVPLDLILKASRNIAIKVVDAEPAAEPAGRPIWDLEGTTIADVKTIAAGLGIDVGTMKKAELVLKIREGHPEYRKPEKPAAGSFEFGANAK